MHVYAWNTPHSLRLSLIWMELSCIKLSYSFKPSVLQALDLNKLINLKPLKKKALKNTSLTGQPLDVGGAGLRGYKKLIS